MKIDTKDCDSLGCTFYNIRLDAVDPMCRREITIPTVQDNPCITACCVICRKCKGEPFKRFEGINPIKLFVFRRKYENLK